MQLTHSRPRKVVRTSVKLSMWHQWFNARWRLTWKRRNCWIYSRNYFCYFMDYQFSHFIDVLTTFLGLELVSSVAVYAGSESSWISSEISSFVFRRWTKVLRVWYEMRVSISWQKFQSAAIWQGCRNYMKSKKDMNSSWILIRWLNVRLIELTECSERFTFHILSMH